MSMTNEHAEALDKRLAAVCGLFCPACSLFIGTREDPKRLKGFAERFHVSEEEVKCDGCRADKRSPYCTTCTFVPCAAEKGLDFCGACPEYPCEDLKTFQAARPHRIELWSAQERINKVGYERWLQEMYEEYSCPQCGVINSAYDLTCRQCGGEPSCEYVRRHRETILQYLANQA